MNTPPVDAICIEPGCTQDATTTRTGTDPWLTSIGVLADVDEWVCATHGTCAIAHIAAFGRRDCVRCGYVIYPYAT